MRVQIQTVMRRLGMLVLGEAGVAFGEAGVTFGESLLIFCNCFHFCNYLKTNGCRYCWGVNTSFACDGDKDRDCLCLSDDMSFILNNFFQIDYSSSSFNCDFIVVVIDGFLWLIVQCFFRKRIPFQVEKNCSRYILPFSATRFGCQPKSISTF
jgi:hypothetical protein